MPEQNSSSNLPIEEDIQVIIGRVPSWITRHGTTIIAGCALLLFICALFIKYPESISGKVVISPSKSPVILISQISGWISEIKVEEGQIVSSNQIIAIVANPANTGDILSLKRVVDYLDTCSNLVSRISTIALPNNLQVGDIQPDYLMLFHAINEVKYSAFMDDISKNRTGYSFSQFRDKAKASTRERRGDAIREIATKIANEITKWDRQYVIRTPVSGKLAYFKTVRLNEKIASGEQLFFVAPKVSEFIARAVFPAHKVGKIKQGQLGFIKLNGYPSGEFGTIRATVSQFTNIAVDNLYSCQLTLMRGLTTTKNIQLNVQAEVSGNVDIIISQKSILRRIFEGMMGISMANN
ncbi:HlyD family secretion protein [Hydrobacter penzbergensis]|uniref:HlyD family secretion protein n=1 Tax=Hydrobacter penzbergensis TaxID=1235997 RepID=A0A8X8ICU8_9BACT|nr:HlyD family efflux transporter periplasmic adaptor subunit [Hydrobacter penzbergensis]SDX01284.1 HlyD family secretion protein [Hydrobacter penzbergensis]